MGFGENVHLLLNSKMWELAGRITDLIVWPWSTPGRLTVTGPEANLLPQGENVSDHPERVKRSKRTSYRNHELQKLSQLSIWNLISLDHERCDMHKIRKLKAVTTNDRVRLNKIL